MLNLDDNLEIVGRSGHVKQFRKLLDLGFHGGDLAPFLIGPDDPQNFHTLLEYLQFLSFDSPKPRELQGDILGSSKKLYIVEEVPLVASYTKLFLELLYFDIGELYSDMPETQREETLALFNIPHSAMHGLIGANGPTVEGMNLHGACCDAVLATPANSTTKEKQQIGRILRVSLSLPLN